MAPKAAGVGTLVIRIQGEFLDRPALRLTAPQAARRFGVERASCEAVLAALAEANVLARSADGEYTRFFPRVARAA